MTVIALTPNQNCTVKWNKNTVKMYILQGIFECTTQFLSGITQISKLFLHRVSYLAFN